MRLHRTIASATATVVVATLSLWLWPDASPATNTAAPRAVTAMTTPTTRSTTTPSTATPIDEASSASATPPRTSLTPSWTAGEDGDATLTMTKPASVPKKGTGHISVLTFPPLAANAVAPAGARPVRFTVEAEGGLGVDLDDYVKTVETVLFDERGWETRDHVRFVNVTPAEAAAGASVDVRITLASPTLTDTLCAPLQTMSSVSCFQRGRSVLNVTRWVHGAAAYGTDSATYRVYQINHEVGHGIGHGHQLCPAEGRRAPVMVQQTLGLHGCLAWPYPVGA